MQLKQIQRWLAGVVVWMCSQILLDRLGCFALGSNRTASVNRCPLAGCLRGKQVCSTKIETIVPDWTFFECYYGGVVHMSRETGVV